MCRSSPAAESMSGVLPNRLRSSLVAATPIWIRFGLSLLMADCKPWKQIKPSSIQAYETLVMKRHHSSIQWKWINIKHIAASQQMVFSLYPALAIPLRSLLVAGVARIVHESTFGYHFAT